MVKISCGHAHWFEISSGPEAALTAIKKHIQQHASPPPTFTEAHVGTLEKVWFECDLKEFLRVWNSFKAYPTITVEEIELNTSIATVPFPLRMFRHKEEQIKSLFGNRVQRFTVTIDGDTREYVGSTCEV
jgi:hypothetical protein